ncbi:MAG TPA: hypothetical protein PK922_01920 [Syntrophorhabdus sp.]|jgi:hypothetical protein|nr:hypothetical protein [Syntrophorhabdus sp.]
MKYNLTAADCFKEMAKQPPEPVIIFSDIEGKGIHQHLLQYGHSARFKEADKVGTAP